MKMHLKNLPHPQIYLYFDGQLKQLNHGNLMEKKVLDIDDLNINKE